MPLPNLVPLSSDERVALRKARNYALMVLDEEEDPSDTNTAITLAELVEEATSFLNDVRD